MIDFPVKCKDCHYYDKSGKKCRYHSLICSDKFACIAGIERLPKPKEGLELYIEELK